MKNQVLTPLQDECSKLHFIAVLTIPNTTDPDYVVTYGNFRDCFNEVTDQYELSLSAAKELRSTDSVNVHYGNSNCFYGEGMNVKIHLITCRCGLYDYCGDCETVQDIAPIED